MSVRPSRAAERRPRPRGVDGSEALMIHRLQQFRQCFSARAGTGGDYAEKVVGRDGSEPPIPGPRALRNAAAAALYSGVSSRVYPTRLRGHVFGCEGCECYVSVPECTPLAVDQPSSSRRICSLEKPARSSARTIKPTCFFVRSWGPWPGRVLFVPSRT